LERSGLVVEDRVHQPAHRLRGWLPGDRLSADEVVESVDAEELPIGVAGPRGHRR
jgi:hypothetical protein